MIRGGSVSTLAFPRVALRVRLLEVREEVPKRILTKAEARTFLKHVKKSDAWDYDMFSLLLHTGLRIAELPITYGCRAGVTKLGSIGDGLRIGRSLVRYRFGG